jgi:adenosylcobinamide kinase/adenosylcobinamide-phosphate guanylyltransferase
MRSILFVGCCRSGKSGLAQRWAEHAAPQRTFFATARPVDEGMRERIARHQNLRGPSWNCVEEPLNVFAAMQAAARSGSVLLLDCVSFWLCNLMEQGLTDKRIMEQVDDLGRWLNAPPLPVALVTHESGCGVAPANALGNRFRDINGEANQVLARYCQTVIFVSCGLPLPLKGALERACVFSSAGS